MIRADYDHDADAIQVWLTDAAEPVESVEIDDRRSVDVDASGNAIGFEVLGAAHYAVDDIAERFGFRELVPEINHQVTAALGRRAAASSRPAIILSGIAGDPPLESGSEPAQALHPVTTS